MTAKIDLSSFQGSLLLTGGAGFIGRQFIKYLAQHNFPMKNLVIGLSKIRPYCFPDAVGAGFYIADLGQESQVKNTFSSYEPTHIVHLAANASPANNNISGMIDLNIKGTNYLLEHCPNNVDFIFASSVLVYGNNSSDNIENDKLKPDSLYGITKVASEHLLNLYYMKGKIRPRILRLCGNVGLGMTHGKILQAQHTNEMKLFGKSPGGYLPLCHVEDTCEAIAKALLSNRPELTANICPDDYISLEESLMAVNPNLHIQWNLDRGCVDMLQCHNERASYLLDWQPKYTSRQALDKYILENSQTS